MMKTDLELGSCWWPRFALLWRKLGFSERQRASPQRNRNRRPGSILSDPLSLVVPEAWLHLYLPIVLLWIPSVAKFLCFCLNRFELSFCHLQFKSYTHLKSIDRKRERCFQFWHWMHLSVRVSSYAAVTNDANLSSLNKNGLVLSDHLSLFVLIWFTPIVSAKLLIEPTLSFRSDLDWIKNYMVTLFISHLCYLSITWGLGWQNGHYLEHCQST